MSDSAEFETLVRTHLGDTLTDEQIGRLIVFREEVLQENAVQNLTRQTSPKDFFEGHVLDVVHLERSGLLQLPALDIGSGMGVPGILHALLFAPQAPVTWISSDSEGKKAEFSKRMIEKFHLTGASALSRRGEEILDTQEVVTVVARAVGSVSKLYGWLRTRSTWNNLVLLKGPKWDEEWRDFQSSPNRDCLTLTDTYEYLSGELNKRLRIVKLTRKP